MIAADIFDCKYFAVFQNVNGIAYRYVRFRSAVVARNRLCVTSNVVACCVFLLTFVAKRKLRHCYVFPVVGQGFNYRISCSAVDTAYERVSVSAVVFVFKLFFAMLTGCQIGSYKRHCKIIFAVNNFEFCEVTLIYLFFV